MGFSINTKKKPSSNLEAGAQGKQKPQANNPFLVKGAAAVALMKKAAAETEANKAKQGKAWRFRIQPGEDANITFLDGALDPDTGILAIPYANEHSIKVNGRWENIPCIDDKEPCPICAAGEKKSFVGYLTIIDHREETGKDGKVYKDQVRLFVAKTDTLKLLTKHASKLGPLGLIGSSFETSRTGDMKPAVGDLYDHLGTNSMEVIAEQFGEHAVPLDYATEVAYLTSDQMKQLGVGKQVATIGSSGFGAKNADDVSEGNNPW